VQRLQALRAGLDRSLFPDAPRVQLAGSRPERLVLVLALLALAVFFQLARAGWSGSIRSLWAEDGQIFLQGALNEDFADAAVSTYAGYLVVVPRLIGEAASHVPLQDAPAAVSILSALVVALSGLAVWHASAAHIRNPYLRGTLAILTVLVPVAGLESIDSAAYVPWYMLFATFWLLLWRPQTTLGAMLASLFILATALSSPGVWFFIPLAALRAVAIRDQRDLMIVGSFALGAAIQAPVVAFNTEEAVTPIWTSDIWTAYIQRVVDGAALGQRLGGTVWSHLGWPFLIALLAALVAGLVAGLRRAASPARLIALIAIPTSLALFVVSVYQRAVATQMMWPEGTYNGSGGRYAIVPALLLVSVALVLLDDAWRRRGRPSRLSMAGAVAAAILVLGIATSFDMRDYPVRGTPPWNTALSEAASTCATESLTETTVPISPPGFAVQLPCDRLASFAEPPLRR